MIPKLPVVLSTTTSTGYALASKESGDYLEAIYNPLDFFWTARRAVRLIRPRRLILVEAEVWPNLTAEARRGGPSWLSSTRGSPFVQNPDIEPFGRWQSRSSTSSIFFASKNRPRRDVGDVWVSKLEKSSAPAASSSMTRRMTGGPLKIFETVLANLGVEESAPIVLAGSTHSGEESVLGEIVIRLKREFPNLFYVVVPRHAERWKEVREQLEKLGLRVALRAHDNSNASHPDTLLVNTTGELRDWYDQATVVFIGKSLTAHGGQNPAEAVAAGKPVVFGPNMENFASLAAQLVREGGALQVADAPELEEELSQTSFGQSDMPSACGERRPVSARALRSDGTNLRRPREA